MFVPHIFKTLYMRIKHVCNNLMPTCFGRLDSIDYSTRVVGYR